MKYILDEDGNPILEEDPVKWAKWFEDCERHLALTKLTDEITVSTVFLGIDHNWQATPDAPVLWETMIFGGEHNEDQWRYASKEDALVGHEKAVRKASAAIPINGEDHD